MSPEQWKGIALPASDQYALGILVYECLCGKRPFYGNSHALGFQHISVPPPPLREQLTTISPTVEQVVMRALEKNPEDRYPSIQDFAQALDLAHQMEQHTIDGWFDEVSNKILVGQKRASTPLNAQILVQHPFQFVRTINAGDNHCSDLSWASDSIRLASISSKSFDIFLGISSTSTRSVYIWDVSKVKNEGLLRKLSHESSCLAWAPNGTQLVVGLNNGSLELWNTNTGNLIRKMTQPDPRTFLQLLRSQKPYVRCVEWSSDGCRLASLQVLENKNSHKIITCKIIIWDVENGTCILSIVDKCSYISWSPDNIHIASVSNGFIKIWDVENGTCILSIMNKLVKMAIWSSNGNRIASVGSGFIEIWNANDGTLVQTITDNVSDSDRIAWSPDGNYLVSAGFGHLKIWNANDGLLLQKLDGELYFPNKVAWSPDGTCIALAHTYTSTMVDEAGVPDIKAYISIYSSSPINLSY